MKANTSVEPILLTDFSSTFSWSPQECTCNTPWLECATYCGVMGYIANYVEVFEQLGGTTVLCRDLLSDFSSNSSRTKK